MILVVPLTSLQLLTRDVDQRLGSGPDGSENVKKHPFFASIDWEKLERKEVEPPFKVSCLLSFADICAAQGEE